LSKKNVRHIVYFWPTKTYLIMNKKYILLSPIFIAFLFLSYSCCTSRNQKKASSITQENTPPKLPSPAVIIYKTKGDYNYNVPVILSVDKTRIISFPDPKDIRIDGNFTYPDELVDGYLLDKRGINEHAAFLKFTYEDYYNMDNIPTAERLMNYILDDDPFIEIYDAGKKGQYKNIIDDLNTMILQGKIREMKNLLKK